MGSFQNAYYQNESTMMQKPLLNQESCWLYMIHDNSYCKQLQSESDNIMTTAEIESDACLHVAINIGLFVHMDLWCSVFALFCIVLISKHTAA